MADLGALGLRGVLGVAAGLKGERVGGNGVHGHMQQEHRVVRRHGVKVAAGDELLAVLPDELVPAVALDPLAGLGLGGLLSHSVQDGLAALDAHEVQVQQVLAAPLRMHVALDEAGREDLARRIDDLGVLADEGLNVGSRAHGDDLAVLGGHAAVLDDREVGLTGLDLVAGDGDSVDLRMLDDQIGFGIPCAHKRSPSLFSG